MPNQCGALILFFKRSNQLFLPVLIFVGSQNNAVKLLQGLYIAIFASNAHSLCLKP